MTIDARCCGTGACIINDEGYCWCGQQWDGEKMCRPALSAVPAPAAKQGETDSPQED